MSQDFADVPLPKAWPDRARAAVVHVIAMANAAMVYARGKAANTPLTTMQLRAKLDNARTEIALLREELRIKDARMAALDSRRRPRYRPTDRMSILELRAARAWSAAETARVFLVEPATIGSWLKRVDEKGEYALVRTPEPVNKYPDFVRHIVCRLKVLLPTLGKKRIAQTLARAGLHIGTTTVKRILEQGPDDQLLDNCEKPSELTAEQTPAEIKKRENNPVKSNRPDHVWLVDLTLVPTSAGFWVPWLPNALAQCWPFCWWVACVADHFSRGVIGFAVFTKQPTALEVRRFLGRAIGKHGQSPKYLISDLGPQFDCDGYRLWCKRKGIKSRYSSAGSRAATAVIERFFLSLKDEMLRRGEVPLRRDELCAFLSSYVVWFGEHRPHQGLGGRTPNEVRFGQKPANEKARIEPRTRWPRKSPCAKPVAPQRGKAGRVVKLVVRYHDGDRRLPLVELRPAA